jgi:SsrA-binding protein
MPPLIYNKKAGFNYEILEKITAGAELLGFEVKSLRKKQGSLEGAYITIRGSEAFLMNTHIPPFQPNNTPKDYDPYRIRKILLTKKEIKRLAEIESKKGLTIIPLSMYNAGRKIKIDIAVARGKRKFDKREVIKKRETEREIRRLSANYYKYNKYE